MKARVKTITPQEDERRHVLARRDPGQVSLFGPEHEKEITSGSTAERQRVRSITSVEATPKEH